LRGKRGSCLEDDLLASSSADTLKNLPFPPQGNADD